MDISTKPYLNNIQRTLNKEALYSKNKVYKYVVTYRSKAILNEETGNYIHLETGCYKWVEENATLNSEAIKYMSISEARQEIFKTGHD